MKDQDTPLKLVRLWPKILPGCYEQLDSLKNAKADGTIWWPDYCELPINAAFTYLCMQNGNNFEEAALVASELTACWMWRKNKIVYAFDPDLIDIFTEQAKDIDDADSLPIELLLHPPYPIVYIKAPGIIDPMDGFFYWVDYDINREGSEIRIQWVTDTFENSFAQVLHITPGLSVIECIQDTIKTTNENIGKPNIYVMESAQKMAGSILTAIQFILYLVAENNDISEDPVGVGVKQPARPSKEKIIDITDKASEIKSYSVGIRIGNVIRKAKVRYQSEHPQTEGSKKRPHSRRGHWHNYWTGPRDGDRKLILKWVAPTFIHADDLDDNEDNIVVFPVKK